MALPDVWAAAGGGAGAADRGAAGTVVSDRLAAVSVGAEAASVVDSAGSAAGEAGALAASVAAAAAEAAPADPGRLVVGGWWLVVCKVDRLRFLGVGSWALGVAYDHDADSQGRSDGAAGGAVDRSLWLFVQPVRQPGGSHQSAVGAGGEPAAATQRLDPQPGRDGEGHGAAGEGRLRTNRRLARQTRRRNDTGAADPGGE